MLAGTPRGISHTAGSLAGARARICCPPTLPTQLGSLNPKRALSRACMCTLRCARSAVYDAHLEAQVLHHAEQGGALLP